MKEELNIDEWARKNHFQFFSQFDEPFFGVCSNIGCTKAYQYCKKEDYSFFLYYLHKVLKAVNQIQQFRYRIDDNKVYVYEKIDASPTINRPDGTFGFGYITYVSNFDVFIKQAEKEIEKVRNADGLAPATSGENVIHFSALPWIDFTSISHARHFGFSDSCPKISVGKMTKLNNRCSMPVSVHVHHGLMGGKHVGQFFELFQELMNK
jgi:chloramphenicol O-acetyltransferase type A